MNAWQKRKPVTIFNPLLAGPWINTAIYSFLSPLGFRNTRSNGRIYYQALE